MLNKKTKQIFASVEENNRYIIIRNKKSTTSFSKKQYIKTGNHLIEGVIKIKDKKSNTIILIILPDNE